ncbi:MAG: hypothetical protein ABIY52_02340 [Gemmatimonadaceae bacterium]
MRQRPGAGNNPCILNVVSMFRHTAGPRALGALTLAFALAAGCADKNVPARSGTQGGSAGEVSTDSSAPAVVAGAAAPAAVTAGPDTSKVVGELPKRSRRDSVALASMTKPDSVLDAKWPVKGPAPLPGALLPSKRIVAFYGNPLEKRMGALGEYPKDQMLGMLDKEVQRWAKADPSHPVIPALHMVVTTAQGAPGKNGLYRLRMRDSLVDAVYGWAKEHKAIFFVDVQLGKDNVQNEIPRLARWLVNPDVHIAVDPEFAMAASGKVPGTKIGTMDASEINWVIHHVDSIVRANKLPPKILVVHRFTRKMVSNARDIRPTPNVQVVMDMDGWGPPWLKFDSYHDYVKAEPVEFTGFKLFFHNDTKKGDLLLTPAEVLRLNPRPLYIQYQ